MIHRETSLARFELRDNPQWEVLTRETMMERKNNEILCERHSGPDFAILQGPPGSGKTTAIIELIVQFAKQNKKVLLLWIDAGVNRQCSITNQR